jgi:hypothetical protein
MASGLSRKAVEKYKTALDMILDHCVEVSVHDSREFAVNYGFEITFSRISEAPNDLRKVSICSSK